MRDAGGLNYSGAFQLNWCSAQVVEHTDAAAEQDRHQVDVYLVENSGLDALLHDTRAGYGDIFVACGLLGLADGTFDAVGNEDEGRAFFDPFLRGRMGNDKGRSAARRVATPGVGDVE